MRGRLSLGRDCGRRGESRDVLRVVAFGQVSGLWAGRGRLGVLGGPGRALCVRGELRSSSSPEPSGGLIGEGQPLRGCEGFFGGAPGIALRHPGLVTGRPYGTGLVRMGGTRSEGLLWGDEWEHPCEELVDAGGFCGGGGVDGEVGAVWFFEA
jgi:hypothetical protein